MRPNSIIWEELKLTLEEEFKLDIERISLEYNLDSIWVRSSGEEINMVDMEDAHIINALRMCKRNLEDPMTKSFSYELLLLEAINRGLIKKRSNEWDRDENV